MKYETYDKFHKRSDEELHFLYGFAQDSYWIGVKGFRVTIVTDSNTGITHIDGHARKVSIRKY